MTSEEWSLTLRNPYPEDIFLNISDEEWDKIDKLLQEHLGFSIDRVSGNIGRIVWKNMMENIDTLYRESQKDKQELQDKILARIAGLLSPPLPPEYTNPENISQLRLDISAIINEEFRKFGEKMNERFGKE